MAINHTLLRQALPVLLKNVVGALTSKTNKALQDSAASSVVLVLACACDLVLPPPPLESPWPATVELPVATWMKEKPA